MNVIYWLMLFSGCQTNVEATYLDTKFRGGNKQLYDNTCGVASFEFILRQYYSIGASELMLINKIGVKPEYSLLDISMQSKIMGLDTIGVKITSKQLRQLHSPAILYINRFGKKHFVVFHGVANGVIQIYDPAWGYINYSFPQFESYWLGDEQFGRALLFLDDINININESLIYQKVVLIE
ncbi:C39 family peptidase [Serratia sp. J2]|uniref:C39 family peptidase n=1 Tax=Serratia sp. J2 TaxID=3386551 RepID=UPI003916CF5F